MDGKEQRTILFTVTLCLSFRHMTEPQGSTPIENDVGAAPLRLEAFRYYDKVYLNRVGGVRMRIKDPFKRGSRSSFFSIPWVQAKHIGSFIY